MLVDIFILIWYFLDLDSFVVIRELDWSGPQCFVNSQRLLYARKASNKNKARKFLDVVIM